MKLAACSIIYLDFATLDECMRRMAKMGYHGMDLWAYSPHLDPQVDRGDRQQIKSLAGDLGLELVGIFDPDVEVTEMAGLSVFGRLDDVGSYDAVVITDLREPQKMFDSLAKTVPHERVLAPRMLNVSRTRPKLVG